MSKSEILRIYNEGANFVVNLVKSLSGKIDTLNDKIDSIVVGNSKLKQRVSYLKNQTRTNSNNSNSKSQLSYRLKKRTKILRIHSGKKLVVGLVLKAHSRKGGKS